MQVKETILKYKVVPVVVINDIQETVSIMESLSAGGLPIAEITFRTKCAKDAIKLACEKFPDMLIGAGTVISAAQCKEALSAGAKFIVGPGFSQSVLEVCKENDVPYYPGCVTPTEIMAAVEGGLDVVKFFPAQVYGGLKAINAIGAAFPSLKFIPTGGVDASNIAEFLENPRIFAVGGSFMMKGSCEEIKNNTAKLMQEVKEIK